MPAPPEGVLGPSIRPAPTGVGGYDNLLTRSEKQQNIAGFRGA